MSFLPLGFQSWENVTLGMPAAILWLPGKSLTESEEKSEKNRSEQWKENKS